MCVRFPSSQPKFWSTSVDALRVNKKPSRGRMNRPSGLPVAATVEQIWRIGSVSFVILRTLKSNSSVMLEAVLLLNASHGSYGIVKYWPARIRSTRCPLSSDTQPSFTKPKFWNTALLPFPSTTSTLSWAALRIRAGLASLLLRTFGFKKKSAPVVGLNFSVLSTVMISTSLPVLSSRKLTSVLPDLRNTFK